MVAGNFTFRKMVISSAFFVLAFAIFSSLAAACINPGLRTDAGVPINSFGGFFKVNGSNYPGNDVLLITYYMQVRNANDQGMTVFLEPDSTIRDYVQSSSVYVSAHAGENGNPPGILPIQVWIGGIEKDGALNVVFQCDDGTPQFVSPFVIIWIIGKGIAAPPAATCYQPSLNNGCYQGVYRTYSCTSNDLTYTARCTDYCCQNFGGEDAVCSTDRSTCFSFNDLPEPTEGTVAFLCSSDDCNRGIEKKVWFLLRLKGWDVVAKAYDEWTADELQQYDIIACSESRACDYDFNSLLYNIHYDKQIPFLEIPGSNGAKAAYSFDYVSTGGGKSVRDMQMNYAADYITAGIGSPGIAVNGNNFAGVDGKKLSQEVKWIANSTDDGNEMNPLIFKVKEEIDHGRYAYIGLFNKAGLSSMTVDGEKIFNNTLKWLKSGDEAFGGSNDNTPRKGTVAFMCSNDRCSSKYDEELIKFLRSTGYSVDSQSLKNWLLSDVSSYNMFVCSSSRNCKIPVGSNIYNAYMFGGKEFVEIADTSKAYAAFNFGYLSDAALKRKSSTNVSFASGEPISTGLPSLLTVNKRSRGMAALENPLSLPLTDVAHINFKGVDQHLSTMFYVADSGSHGRYLFVGWVGRFDTKYITSDGLMLLQRGINWANCGSIAC